MNTPEKLKPTRINELHIARARVAAQPIIDVCADVFGVQRDAVIGSGRTAELYMARRLAMYYLAQDQPVDVVAAVFRRAQNSVRYCLAEHVEALGIDAFYRTRCARVQAQLFPNSTAPTP